MTKTIAVVSGKGGTSKSSIVIELTLALAHHNQKVAVLDADPQETVVRFRTRRDTARCIPSLEVFVPDWNASLPDNVDAMAADVELDFVVIDTGPAGLDTMTEAIQASDLAVVPTGATVAELEQVGVALSAAARCRKPALIVLTRLGDTDLAAAGLAHLEASGKRISNGAMMVRESYPEAHAAGRAAYEVDAKAREDIEAILADVLACLSAKPTVVRRQAAPQSPTEARPKGKWKRQSS
jgi:chromosome partitioning protein